MAMQGRFGQLLAKGWYSFAAEQISSQTRRWMATLPTTLTFRAGGQSFQVVHGGLAQNNKILFVSQSDAIAAELAGAVEDVVIAGQAGLPFISEHSKNEQRPAPKCVSSLAAISSTSSRNHTVHIS
jgi:hypothetical protein